jgi:hypothetical protein
VQYDANGKLRNNVGGGSLAFVPAASSENVVPNPVTDSNFTNRTGNIDNGRLTNAAGFDLINFAANAPNPVLITDSDNSLRKCVAASTRGIVVGIAIDLEVDSQERTDLIQTSQLVSTITMGAVRTEGVLIQELQTPWAA